MCNSHLTKRASRRWPLLLAAGATVLLGMPDPVRAQASVTVDGAETFQTIDGFGVNANHDSWNGDELKPAIALLTDGLNATLWRVVVDEMDWEAENDNDDPARFNWAYYDAVYGSPRFQKVWDMLHYLNQQGITRGIVINFMGRTPRWMGYEYVEESREDEFVEMVVSFVCYLSHREGRNIRFGYLAPTNEPNIMNEGPRMEPEQYARVMRKLVDRLEAEGLGSISLILPDCAGDPGRYPGLLLADRAIMARLEHFGAHDYGGSSHGMEALIDSSAYPDRDFWMTEWNSWCTTCDHGQYASSYAYDYASVGTRYLLNHLRDGASAAVVWEGYDSKYAHSPSTWSYWGLLAYDAATRTYSARKGLYTFAQVARFVLPGYRRIGASDPGNDVSLLAFRGGRDATPIVLVGENRNAAPVSLSVALRNLPEVARFRLHYTDATVNLQTAAVAQVDRGSFSLTIPPACIYTLVGEPTAPEDRAVAPGAPEPGTGVFVAERDRSTGAKP